MLSNIEFEEESYLDDYDELEFLGRRSLHDIMKDFITEEDGMGTVEVILIIVVLVGLVLIFKDQITDIVNNLFSGITKNTNKILK